MRKIKFRAKAVPQDEWIYGHFCFASEAFGMPHNIPSIQQFNEDESQTLSFRQIRPYTVGQFTGLYDKNNEEIYEGDIVRFDNHLQGVSKVLYDSGQYTVESKNYSTALTYRIAIHAVIIGNIHDNPELLKTE